MLDPNLKIEIHDFASSSLLFFFFLLGASLLMAEEPVHEKIEITAKHLDSTKTAVTATDGVVVYYQDSVIKADSARYNKETQLLVLDGNIEMIGYQGTKEHMKHLEIHTDTHEVHFEELFFISRNDVWLFTQQANKKDGNYSFGETVLSSCEVTDPTWKMVASRARYDSEEKYMRAYNAKMYFLDVPVFYTPYMAFSTDRQRKSGLLFPFMGYHANEGFIYEQPVYWAISASMDLELNPQIRTERGYGMYGTFRFVDSDHSSGSVRVGYFEDTEAYREKMGTDELRHYGMEARYDSTRVISGLLPEGFRDEVYLNAIYLNDIEYLNLQQNQFSTFGQTPIQESRLNYFLANDDYYLGLNAKYFIDTRKTEEDQKTVIQQLPLIQLHKYLDKLVWDNLTYSIDTQFKNFDRIEGSSMKQMEMKVPVEFTTAFWDDYLNVSLSETLYYSKSFFGGGDFTYNDFQYFNNYHSAKLFSDLTKKYDSFIHVLQPSLGYVLPGAESQQPVDFEDLDSKLRELFVVSPKEEYYQLGFSQFFYDNAMNLKFYQRLYQRYYSDREYHWSDISNEMEYIWKKWRFYSNVLYSVEFSDISESSTRISLNESMYNLSLSHTFKQVFPTTDSSITANDINLNFGYRWNDHLRFNGGLSYDIETSESRQWLFGVDYAKDCWGVSAALREDITPRPGGEATTNTSFYIQLDLKPFISLGSKSFEGAGQ